VGISKIIKKEPSNIFLKGQAPYITVNQTSKEINVLPNIELNDFYTNLGLKGNDVLVSFNDKKYDLTNIYEMISESGKWKENDAITIKIKRDGKEQIITGKVKLPYEEKESFEANDISKSILKNSWLKG
jgi:type II secretory pathway component PulC